MQGMGSSAIGAVGGAVGAGITSALSAKEAKKDRKFQERMSSTAYQRSMADMRKAGLNPLLAYSKGGASTPGGAQARPGDFSKVVNSALNAAQIGLTKAQTKKVITETELTAAQIPKAKVKSAGWELLSDGISSARDYIRPKVEAWREKDRPNQSREEFDYEAWRKRRQQKR